MSVFAFLVLSVNCGAPLRERGVHQIIEQALHAEVSQRADPVAENASLRSAVAGGDRERVANAGDQADRIREAADPGGGGENPAAIESWDGAGAGDPGDLLCRCPHRVEALVVEEPPAQLEMDSLHMDGLGALHRRSCYGALLLSANSCAQELGQWWI